MTVLMSVLAALLLSLLGPALILGEEGSGPVFAAICACVLACVAGARIAWRRWPETEWFAAFLLLGAAIWVGSGWLLLLVRAV